MKPSTGRLFWAAVAVGFAIPGAQGAGLSHPYCGTHSHRADSLIANHIATRAQRPLRGLAAALPSTQIAAGALVSQVGEVAVVRDQGDLIKRANILDLQGKALEFRPGYTVSAISYPLDPDGTPVALGDDATRESPLPFAFPFFGTSYDKVWVNSDGNLTFGAGDAASTSRDIGRLVSGPPRVAPLLTDLDPSAAGSVSITSRGDAFIVKWTNVPQFEKTDKNTFQVSLFPDGRIVFAYDTTNLNVAIEEGATGISAGGGTAGLAVIDLSAAAGTAFERSIAEGFNLNEELDLTGVVKAFYGTYPDDFDQVVVYTNRAYIPRDQGAFAYESTVRNQIAGIGNTIFDNSRGVGSAGRLESVVMMDSYHKYTENPSMPVLREETTLSVLAHEVGHRWLATARFNDGTGSSGELLGRQQAHWSFYMHSSGSHDEGNDIQDLGGGLFKTGPTSARYGPLDQYLMGIRTPEEVPPVFIIKTPIHDGSVSEERAPQSNFEIRGTRKDIPLAQIVAAIGERSPAARSTGDAPWRIAFIYFTEGSDVDGTASARVDAIRAQFEGFFANSTEGRWSVDTRLR